MRARTVEHPAASSIPSARPGTGLAHRRFTRAEYERMVEAGILDADERVELLDGEIVPMSPQGDRHVLVVYRVAKLLEAAFGRGFFILTQSSHPLDDLSKPEPDVAVIRGAPEDYSGGRARRAALVAEVAETTLARDQLKASLYARAHVPEYWLADLGRDELIVHRAPRRSKPASHGWVYSDVATLARGRVRPLDARRSVAVARVFEL